MPKIKPTTSADSTVPEELVKSFSMAGIYAHKVYAVKPTKDIAKRIQPALAFFPSYQIPKV